MPKTFSLILSAPGADAIQFRLTDDRVTLGRDGQNLIVLSEQAVSSRHCEFQRAEGGGYRVVDLGSTNGTRVNGQRVMSPEGIPLKNGDRILLAETLEGHFIEAIEGGVARKPEPPARFERHRVNGNGSTGINGGVTQALRSGGPVPVWVDASAIAVSEEEMNPVAAAVARQEAALGQPKIGKRPG